MIPKLRLQGHASRNQLTHLYQAQLPREAPPAPSCKPDRKQLGLLDLVETIF
jgi:hypothetical protein